MKPRFGSGSQPIPDGSPDAAQLRVLGLLAIADLGCELQDRAEAVLRGCACTSRPDISLAREGGYVAGEYHRLSAWAADAERDAGIEALRRRITLLLSQHCMFVHHAVRLAFPRGATPPRDYRRHIAPDLGDAGRRLRASRDELARIVES
jgi:hypothetical protein